MIEQLTLEQCFPKAERIYWLAADVSLDELRSHVRYAVKQIPAGERLDALACLFTSLVPRAFAIRHAAEDVRELAASLDPYVLPDRTTWPRLQSDHWHALCYAVSQIPAGERLDALDSLWRSVLPRACRTASAALRVYEWCEWEDSEWED